MALQPLLLCWQLSACVHCVLLLCVALRAPFQTTQTVRDHCFKMCITSPSSSLSSSEQKCLGRCMDRYQDVSVHVHVKKCLACVSEGAGTWIECSCAYVYLAACLLSLTPPPVCLKALLLHMALAAANSSRPKQPAALSVTAAQRAVALSSGVMIALRHCGLLSLRNGAKGACASVSLACF